MTAVDLLAELRRLDVRLWVTDEGRIRFGGRADVLTLELRDRIKTHKSDLLMMLTTEALEADAREHFEERAGIAEHDGQMSRDEAEQEAGRRIYEYRITDNPNWLIILGRAGADEVEIRQRLTELFGARLEAMRPYRKEATR